MLITVGGREDGECGRARVYSPDATTGSATLRVLLHPWLQPAAPSGGAAAFGAWGVRREAGEVVVAGGAVARPRAVTPPEACGGHGRGDRGDPERHHDPPPPGTGLGVPSRPFGIRPPAPGRAPIVEPDIPEPLLRSLLRPVGGRDVEATASCQRAEAAAGAGRVGEECPEPDGREPCGDERHADDRAQPPGDPSPPSVSTASPHGCIKIRWGWAVAACAVGVREDVPAPRVETFFACPFRAKRKRREKGERGLPGVRPPVAAFTPWQPQPAPSGRPLRGW